MLEMHREAQRRPRAPPRRRSLRPLPRPDAAALRDLDRFTPPKLRPGTGRITPGRKGAGSSVAAPSEERRVGGGSPAPEASGQSGLPLPSHLQRNADGTLPAPGARGQVRVRRDNSTRIPKQETSAEAADALGTP